VFGDQQKATQWLLTPLEILGERSPVEFMVNNEGIALVEQTLIRIEHNIVASQTTAQIVRKMRDAAGRA
jgi:uncharacterized protein (DUF2384 family)